MVQRLARAKRAPRATPARRAPACRRTSARCPRRRSLLGGRAPRADLEGRKPPTLTQLRKMATTLGLPAHGCKAALFKRVRLHLAVFVDGA